MGSDSGSRFEKPQHFVRITRDFFIDTTEVTVEAYSSCMKDKACSTPRFKSVRGRGEDHVRISRSSRRCASMRLPASSTW